MSAFLCHHDTIDLIASAAAFYTGPNKVQYFEPGTVRAPAANAVHTHDGATIGRILYDENVYSLRARYGDDEAMADAIDAGPYRFRAVDLTLLPPDRRAAIVLKSIACLRYQSCESDDYDASAAAKVLAGIEAVINERGHNWRDSPAGRAAPWGWTRADLGVAV